MSIKEINNNGKSKIISSKNGVMNAPKHGHTGNKANSSAPSHQSKPIVNKGHANHPNTPTVKGVMGQGTN